MLNAIKETKPLTNFASNVFNMIHDIKIPRYLKVLTLFTLWSKIDTVRATLLANFLLLPISVRLVFFEIQS